jgi:hypothetical protein
MADDQKIVVEIPSDRGYSPIPNSQSPTPNKLEQFKKGWVNAIALPDNLPDAALDLTACVAIPSLFSSCWVKLPIPGFIRLGMLGILALTGVLVCYLHQAVPEIRSALLIRVSLVGLGVLLGI